ncbi:Metallo-dependent hydrolase [Annulohypoxylon maeteangense]|uniref:Metallo-dependent hydrolase n=1 Tax=Annulohypoxylon maeteangense TaxID=1927788 RepID=UPI002007B3A2|nr:Metallo-dependent hydrolase [Annulohypoxylon maeteangense]KAI0887672.1 Metallo-dependent hydrolase [Annulohypoxylon maeteangense]
MTPELGLDFKSMPKIELHAHLSGSISRQCLHEIWEMKKAARKTDLEDPLLVMPPGRHDYDLKTFFPLFSSYIYNLIDDVSSLEHSTKSVIRDFAHDGVVYLELRTTPRAMPTAGLDKAGYVDTVLRAIEDARADTPTLHTRLILSIDRRNSLDEAGEAVALAKLFRDRGVVAVDLCGDPTKGDVSLFTPVIEEARAAGLKITIHFAEAEASASEAELNTIMSWMPDRLGHVIHVSEAIKRQIAERGGIGLELCLSCNVHAKMIVGSFEAHHFGGWWRVDGPIVVPCTDDVGIFGSPLSNEWRLIQHHFRLQREEILGLAKKGIGAIFAGDGERERLRRLMW